MKKYSVLMVSVVLFCTPVPAVLGDTLYYNDFNSYSQETLIDGHDGWIDSGAPYVWRVIDPDQYPSPAGQYIHDGMVLVRNNALCTTPNEDYAILHVANPGGFNGLSISFLYELAANEEAEIDISRNNLDWLDVTPQFGLIHRASNDLTWAAAADLSAEAQQEGIQNDLYIRFMAWNPTGAEDWNAITIDNLIVQNTPEPSTLILLGAGVISLLAYVWRRRKSAV